MTEGQIRVEALLIVAQRQLDQVASRISLLRSLNHGGDLKSFCEISDANTIGIQAMSVALFRAHLVHDPRAALTLTEMLAEQNGPVQ